MRVMRIESTGPLSDHPLVRAEVDAPEPGPKEVRLEIEACGACRTDLHLVEGDIPLPKTPRVPGHQIVGRVRARGKDAWRLKMGSRVGVTWLAGACGACAFCAGGRENLCPEARCTGRDLDGGFAEACVVPEDACHPLPEEEPAERLAPLLCGGAVGYRALRLSGAAPGQTVGLVGFGSSAHIVLQAARAKGMEALVFTRSESHRRLARELGARWAGGIEDEAPSALDAAVVFAPAGEVVPPTLAKLRPGGTLVCAGIHMSPIPELPYARLFEERVLRSTTNLTWRDARELVELHRERGFRTRVETFPLEDANAALRAIRESRVDGSAVLVPG